MILLISEDVGFMVQRFSITQSNLFWYSSGRSCGDDDDTDFFSKAHRRVNCIFKVISFVNISCRSCCISSASWLKKLSVAVYCLRLYPVMFLLLGPVLFINTLSSYHFNNITNVWFMSVFYYAFNQERDDFFFFFSLLDYSFCLESCWPATLLQPHGQQADFNLFLF